MSVKKSKQVKKIEHRILVERVKLFSYAGLLLAMGLGVTIIVFIGWQRGMTMKGQSIWAKDQVFLDTTQNEKPYINSISKETDYLLKMKK